MVLDMQEIMPRTVSKVGDRRRGGELQQGRGTHSLDIEILSYILAAEIDTFAAVREDVLLRMMTAVD